MVNGEIVLPPIETFTREENVKDQARKVLEEAAEMFVPAAEYESATITNKIGLTYAHVMLRPLVIEEAMDTIQAICNLFELLEVSDDEILKAYQDVVRKNKERGYYNGR